MPFFMENVILSALGITKSFTLKKGERIDVLRGIGLQIERGSFSSLMGPSGVGKSTLLYILGTIDFPDNGEVRYFINGTTEIKYLNDRELSRFRNNNIGFVFQFHHLLPEFTALENVMMPALIMGVSKAESSEKAKLLMDKTGVYHRAGNKPAELSGGEQQRIALARALVNNPDIVFADEPTGNLDSSSSQAVIKLISKLREEMGITFVVATHSSDIADASDRVIRMADGIISEV